MPSSNSWFVLGGTIKKPTESTILVKAMWVYILCVSLAMTPKGNWALVGHLFLSAPAKNSTLMVLNRSEVQNLSQRRRTKWNNRDYEKTSPGNGAGRSKFPFKLVSDSNFKSEIKRRRRKTDRRFDDFRDQRKLLSALFSRIWLKSIWFRFIIIRPMEVFMQVAQDGFDFVIATMD